MLKLLVITTICCLAAVSQCDDRLAKLETMVAEQQVAMEEQRAVVKKQGVVMEQALGEIKQLKRKLAGKCINVLTTIS